MIRVRQGVLAFVVALVCVLAGCVNVPTSGPIDKVEGQEPGCQNCINVEVAPPSPGADQKSIVDGYLRATSNYQPNYAVAKQFLSKVAVEKWTPETGVLIYTGVVRTEKDDIILKGTLIGQLGKDRTYSARNQDLKINFGLVRENGEWRIGSPPPGLMVAEFSFTTFYQSYELYFLGNNTTLVPDPIYLPRLRNPENVASALVKALLGGPSKWLKPAVTTAIPPGTMLSVDSVTITDGIADVPLSEDVLTLSDAQRSLLAAQVIYTLKQVVGIKGVLFSVNQQPLRVPESDPGTPAVSINAIKPERNPIPSVAADQLYALRGSSVQQVNASTVDPTLRAIPGPLGAGVYAVDSLAVSVTNTDVAVVTDGRSTLRRGPTANSDRRGEPAQDGPERPAAAAVHPLRRDLRHRPARTVGRRCGCSPTPTASTGSRSMSAMCSARTSARSRSPPTEAGSP